MNPLRSYSVALVPLFLLAACSHTIPEYSAKPAPTPQFSAPPAGVSALPATQLPESVVPVTLMVDLAPIQKAIQEAVPERFSDTDHPLGTDFRWSFLRDGDPQITIQDGLVTIHAPYRGDIEARASSRGCRLDPLYPVLDGTGQLALRPDGDHLVFTLANPQMTMQLKPESDGRCNMFNIPVKDQLAELVNHEAVKQQLSEAVERAGLKIPIQQVWNRLQGPLSVSIVPFNTQLCMYGKTSEMTIGQLQGSAQQTMVIGAARQTPTAIYENICHKAPVSPVNITSGTPMTGEQPFKVLATIPITYATLNQALQEKLFHTEVPLDTTFGGKLIIERASAADAAGRVMIAVQTSGDVNGTIYYWGTPQLEDRGSRLTVPDLQMAAESKSALDAIKVGYWQLVDKDLRDKVRQAATVDLSQRIGKMKTAMTGQHRTGDMTMDILVARQNPARAYSVPQAIVADILLEGTASAAGRLKVESDPASPAPMISNKPATTM